ncbi:helix-turn-helix domain-containing protein [Escherichia coli]|jgi:transcriptional regulator with XRE-family HTH domain|uniref:helix-turn-helix domain-containing protein n=1 Tax=Escherichia coli TaxID=562 RepID=UPI00068FCDC4|nr:helix-turn-helix transcriptional regulator [Escherichia coli]EFH9397034.1 helix-turn-helix domain-containing protein [Escherichia coli]EFN4638917.1 helix-turn-helix transcriptional regulator [Escherichia coli]EFN5654963.1 helix-turn-helix transcriptional regulator [Escherichia coli]EGM8301888.1 helix-turn-helix transcriptional regulator [Escherichia coli]EHJ8100309.1 helix-turn-helix transcriptional regulator [Escherichia coli]
MVNNRSFVERFSIKINDIRVEKNLTIEQLADLASVHRTTIGLIIRNERSPSLQMAKQITDALGIHLSEIIAQIEVEIEIDKGID